jgi:CheY-like chemotaxis protein
MGHSLEISRTILCIDDDTETLEVRRRVLQNAGYRVRTAGSGREGLHILATDGPVDLVILDYLMPAMNGHRLAERIRSQFPRIPLIAMSAVALPPAMLELVDAYIQKGQDVEVLLSAIARTLSSSEDDTVERNPKPGMAVRTVLCIEDEENQLAARKMLLESAGFRVLLARNGSEGLAIFRQEKALDAVVVDYYMPGMRGLSVASEMKRLRPNVPVIVLSGFASLPDEIIGIVDAWVQKRDIDVFLRELEKAIARKAAREAVA